MWKKIHRSSKHLKTKALDDTRLNGALCGVQDLIVSWPCSHALVSGDFASDRLALDPLSRDHPKQAKFVNFQLLIIC